MRYFTCLIVAFAFFSSVAQPAFQNEILEFKRLDTASPPPKKAILFVGSSSFRLWKNMERDFASHKVINRGFGGSTLMDVNRYMDDIIIPYEPKQIIIYCGENDIASGATPQIVLDRFDKLFTAIRRKLPRVPIVFVSMKPSPSREKFREDIVRGNVLIREYLEGHKNTRYVDVYSRMLDESGKPKADLFLSDDLHMNEKGYAIWTTAITPVLK